MIQKKWIRVWREWWGVGAILIVVVLLYGNIFANEFVGDDIEFIVNWQATRDWSSWKALVEGELPERVVGVYRPVRSLVYLLTYQTFGLAEVYYHGFSLMVHVAGIVGVYLLGRRLFEERVAALMMAAAFGLHPVQTEAITYITASFDTLGMVLAIWAFWAFVMSREKKGRKNRWWLRGSYGLGLIACLINEISLALPFLVGFYLWVYEGKFWQKKKLIRVAINYGLLAMLVVGWRFGVVGVTSRGEYINSSEIQTMMVSGKALVRYVQLAVWPVNLNLTHELPGGIRVSETRNLVNQAVAKQSVTEPALLTAYGLVVVWMMLIVYGKKWPEVRLGLGWFGLSLLPVVNIVPSASFVAERYMYLALVGFSILMGAGMEKLKKRGKGWSAGLVAGILVVGVYVPVTVARNYVWSDKLSLWSVTARDNQKNSWAQFKLGEAYQNYRLFEEASDQYLRAIELNPDFGLAYRNLAMVYEIRGEMEKAEAYYLTAVEKAGDGGEVIQSLIDFQGRVLMGRKQ